MCNLFRIFAKRKKMNRYHLLLITPTENKKFSIIADDFYNDAGSLVFTDSDDDVIAVYPVGITAIESIDYVSDEF